MLFKKKESKGKIAKWGIGAGFLECLYIFLVILIFNLIELSGKKMDSVLAGGLFMLLFFVISVLISGVLVLGRPVILVLDKKIMQAISVFFVTLVTMLVVFTIVAIIIFV